MSLPLGTVRIQSTFDLVSDDLVKDLHLGKDFPDFQLFSMHILSCQFRKETFFPKTVDFSKIEGRLYCTMYYRMIK